MKWNVIKYMVILLFLVNCKTVCKSDYLCEQEVDTDHPLFSIARSVISKGMDIGK